MKPEKCSLFILRVECAPFENDKNRFWFVGRFKVSYDILTKLKLNEIKAKVLFFPLICVTSRNFVSRSNCLDLNIDYETGKYSHFILRVECAPFENDKNRFLFVGRFKVSYDILTKMKLIWYWSWNVVLYSHMCHIAELYVWVLLFWFKDGPWNRKI